MDRILPLVTAVITTYNRPQFVRRAIRSVVAQTYHPLEILVVENGSDSGVEDWLQKEQLHNVRYMRHAEKKSLAAARNTGLHHAQGDYVAYLDDDDEWLPEKLTKQLALAETTEESCAVIYCGARVFASDGTFLREHTPLLKGDIRQAIREHGLVTIPSSCVFRRKALQRVGGYDEQLRSHTDHYIWMRFASKKYAAEYVGECLVNAYQSPGSQMTTDIDARIQATRVFCEQWEPELTIWFGPKGAQKYLARFKATVLNMLGWACLYQKKRRESIKYFLTAIYYHPTKFRYYSGIVASFTGQNVYNRIIRCWKTRR